MPTFTVNDTGDVLYYEDTGAPKGVQEYHTIILVHGFIFNSAIFRPLFQYADAYKLRFVAVSQRDYPPSSLYTPQDMQALAGADTQAGFIAQAGRELAVFIEKFVQESNIPPIRHEGEKRVGGASLLTWSLGNILAWSLLGNAAGFEQHTLDVLAKYLRTMVVYDTPNVTLGMPLPDEIYLPFRDPSILPRDLARRFMIWVSTVYPPVPSLDTVTVADLADRPGLDETTDDPANRPTYARMTPAQRADVTDATILQRSGGPLLGLGAPIYYANFQRTLFDTRGVLPSVDVRLWWCDMSVSDCVYGAKLLWDSLKNPQTADGQRRTVKMEKLPGANHYLHWEDPERMVRLLAESF